MTDKSKRSFLARITGGAALLAAGSSITGCASTGAGYTGINDNDPSDIRGYGGRRMAGGVSDQDPSDPTGGGRGGTRQAGSSGGYTTRGSDMDSGDQAGNARGAYTGYSDQNQSDRSGYGRRPN